MIGRKFSGGLISLLLQFVLLAKLLALPIPMSMMPSDMMDSHHTAHASNPSNQNNHTAMQCCEIIGSSCLFSIVAIFQFSEFSLNLKSQKFELSNFSVKFIIVQNTSPPPKI